MDTARVEIIVPKDMMPYIIASSPENDLKRNAMMLYPHIMNCNISYGRAAEILGISKYDLIALYDIMGVPYLSIDISEIDRDVETYYSLVGTEA